MQQMTLFRATELPEAQPVTVEKNGTGTRLRYYQKEAFENATRLFVDGVPGVLIRAATGTGKTIMASSIMDWWLNQDNDNRVMVLCHERQLVYQFREEIYDTIGVDPHIEMGDIWASVGAEMPLVVVASRQSLLVRGSGEKRKSRLWRFDPDEFNWLVIADEAHRYVMKNKSCGHVFDWFARNPRSRRLGITATPRRGDKISLASVFPGVACDYPMYTIDPSKPCAVRDGYAVPYDQRFVRVDGVDFANLKEVRNDFDDQELADVLMRRERLMSLIQPMLDLVEDRRTIIFSPTVEMAHEVAETINAETGVSDAAMSLTGEDAWQIRKSVYKAHQSGATQFLSVCGLCREGYNDCFVNAIAIFRPTKNVSLSEQMRGRGCRPLPGLVEGIETAEERRLAIANSPKPDCMVVDLVGISGLCDSATTVDILAEGLPDRVAEIAHEMAKQAALEGEELDPLKTIEAATQEAAEEDARRRREEIEKAARRESKIKANVRYHQRVIGGIGIRDLDTNVARQDRPMRYMPFGKYKGKPLDQIPFGYLIWLKSSNKSKRLLDAIDGIISSRKKQTPQSFDDKVNKMLQESGS